MAWTAPITWIDGAVLTAAQLNTNLRDNFLEQIPAKSTHNGGAGGGYFTIDSPHKLVERGFAHHEISTSQTTASTSYTDLATVGPTVSVVTGTRAWILYNAEVASATQGKHGRVTIEISGATVKAPDDGFSTIDFSDTNCFSTKGSWVYVDDLNPGLNIFTMKYAGTEANTVTFLNRRLHVFPL